MITAARFVADNAIPQHCKFCDGCIDVGVPHIIITGQGQESAQPETIVVHGWCVRLHKDLDPKLASALRTFAEHQLTRSR